MYIYVNIVEYVLYLAFPRGSSGNIYIINHHITSEEDVKNSWMSALGSIFYHTWIRRQGECTYFLNQFYVEIFNYTVQCTSMKKLFLRMDTKIREQTLSSQSEMIVFLHFPENNFFRETITENKIPAEDITLN
jgi:hypothetical protein